jgi:enoyl-CoA hydratase
VPKRRSLIEQESNMADIETDRPADGVLRITLNRPASMNAFTYDMYEQLIALLERVSFDSESQTVILTGAGKAFCAGHDMKDAGEPAWVRKGLGRAQTTRAIMARLGRIPVLLRALPQPVIAAVNGPTAGVGYALALSADICLAARSAKFVNAFHNAGTGHELGFSYLLPRAVGSQRAAELMFTGRPVLADEAERIGLILRAVDGELLATEALALADSILSNSPIGISLTKQSLWLNQSAGSLEAAIELENRAVFMSQSTEDTAEKRRAFIEKRKPRFTGR